MSQLEIETLVDKILSSKRVTRAREITAWRKQASDVRHLLDRDYVRCLRRGVGYRQLTTLLTTANEMLAKLGHRRPGPLKERELRRLAGNLGVHLKADPNEGPEGMALRGFYLDRCRGLLQRPLIYVNTAHVPLAVSVTFCHEFAHYLAAQLFDGSHKPQHFFFDADYATHLDDPAELAADALVSIRSYSPSVARRIFGASWNWGLVAQTAGMSADAVSQVRDYLKTRFRFGFSPRIPTPQNLHYLIGMVHYAKLRWALLAEYDI
jgi:hypothetical protein